MGVSARGLVPAYPNLAGGEPKPRHRAGLTQACQSSAHGKTADALGCHWALRQTGLDTKLTIHETGHGGTGHEIQNPFESYPIMGCKPTLPLVYEACQ